MMGYFSQLLESRDLVKHDGRPLWNYNLSDIEFIKLQKELNEVSLHFLDERDAALYFAEWWKRSYNGGFPSKQEVFNSLGRNDCRALTADIFYNEAKKGAQRLGVKWIQKQNTLYFKTLLLQGGIPIKHVAENKSYYLNFLLQLMELKPNNIEEIALLPDLQKLLPNSSRNDIIYENCLSIINSILNDEETYTSLLEGNSSLQEIRTALTVKKAQLSNVARAIRPRIFWIMKLKEGTANIHLRMGFSNKYAATSLSEILNLSETAEERSYHLYLDERLVCSFKKMLSGDYKTEWENQKHYSWYSDKLAPVFYCISNDKRWEVGDLIPAYPSINGPSLWASFAENEWRLVKGNSTNTAEALLLYPPDWQNSSLVSQTIEIDQNTMRAVQFEGETTIFNGDQSNSFVSNVDSFDWHVKSEKPAWMRKANLSVVKKHLKLYVYDNEGKLVNHSKYKVSYKSSGSLNSWQLLGSNDNLPIGSIDIKIDYNSITAFDVVYNIADLSLAVTEQEFNSANLNWNNNNAFNIQAKETDKYSVVSNANKFQLLLNTVRPYFPDSIPFKLKYKTQKSLYFDIPSPFSGIGLIDKDGMLLKEGTELTINDLHGIRILTTHAAETIINFWNGLRNQVKISKTIYFGNQPLIAFKEELQRLFYLADAMRFDNFVKIEISNGISNCNYKLKGFSHTIGNVDSQFLGKIEFENTDIPMQLFAVPLNCNSDEIQLLSMQVDEYNYHHLPESTNSKQFVIISENISGKQLQPRFINTEPYYNSENPSDRLNRYHNILCQSEFTSEPWEALKAYYNICNQQHIPFSTFDQIRAIGRSSALASKAFFFLGINQNDPEDYIQRQLPALEQDLGFCFHWINKKDWENAINEAENWIGSEYVAQIFSLMSKYFQEIKLDFLSNFIGGSKLKETIRVNNQIINEARSILGNRVLRELPKDTPHTTGEYDIPVTDNIAIKLLLRAPIAVSESILNIAVKSIWEDSEFVSNLRRNIQYAQFVAPELYFKVLYHCLT